MLVRRMAGGQVAVELGMVLAVAGIVGLTVVQLAGFGLTAAKVGHAAQEAAFVAASTDDPSPAAQTPCWEVSGGLQDPGAYRDAEICRTVLANLGSVDPNRVAVSVSPENRLDRGRQPVRVTVTYAEPIASPLLRWLFGDTFTTSAQASSWSN